MPDKTTLHDSIVRLPDAYGVDDETGLAQESVAPTDLQHKLSFLVSLRSPPGRREELERRVGRGETVSPEDLAREYGASPAERERVRSWLEAAGFEIEGEASDGTGVYARGSLALIAEQLDVTFVRVTQDDAAYFAVRDAPSIPSALGASVRAIVGLQPYRHPRKRVGSGIVRPDRSSTTTGYTVAQIAHAYGADRTGLTGGGQIIAILIDTLPHDRDVEAFWKRNKISSDISRITKIDVAGAKLPAIEGEESLDVEWTSGIATGADIRVYAAGSLDWVALDKAIDQIITDLTAFPSMRQLSISLGLGETYMQGAAGEVDTQHSKFTSLAALGINVFVASGDAGSNPDQTGQSSTGPTQVEYAASDPSVIGVGGTSLVLDPNGNVVSEIGWSGSGGGLSTLFARPVWQTGLGVPAGSARAVPDIGLVAAPQPGGMTVIDGKAEPVGGTSWATPVCAAFCAMVNQARAAAGMAPLPFLNPLLYPLVGTAAFRDITQGSNGAYSAGVGYDPVSGLGVFDLPGLVAALT